ncbi:aspartate phosphatase [Bacillus velezensis]|nr:aspartate phosphatase [Bacillus velezensis]QTN97671.1 aspartate phosphatase [Bacillus sp. LJBV19]
MEENQDFEENVSDVENFSIEVADYFHERGSLMLSTKIKKGEIIDENQPVSIGCSDFR